MKQNHSQYINLKTGDLGTIRQLSFIDVDEIEEDV